MTRRPILLLAPSHVRVLIFCAAEARALTQAQISKRLDENFFA